MARPSTRPRLALAVALLAASFACVAPPDPPLDHAAFEDVRRIVAALDDVAGEYRLAVDERGAVVDPVRLRVLGTLMHDAEVYAQRFAAPERAALHELAVAIGGRAPAAGVVATARALRRQALARRRLVLAPGAPPPRARAEEMWRSQCAGCHGPTGVGDGVQGLDLEPEPKNFHDPEVMAALTPSRAFSRIVDGVRGTAMPSWGYLSVAERWALAFLALSFQHDPAAVDRGRGVARRHQVSVSPSWLADRTDPELGDELRALGLDQAAVADVIAFARAEAGFAPTTGPFAEVRGALSDGVVSYRARRFDQAPAHFAAARARLLVQIDELRAADPALAASLEVRFRHLSRVVAQGALAEVVERETAGVQSLLDRAESSLRRRRVCGGIRLALERVGLVAIALGLALGHALGQALGQRRRRAAVPAVAALLVGAPLGFAVAGTDAAGFVVLTAALVAIVALWSRPSAALAAAMALVAAVAAGELTSGLAAGPLYAGLAGIAALALASAAIGWLARGTASPITAAVTVVAAVIATTAAAGHGAWLIWARGGGEVALLAVPRIEAIGLYPVATVVAWSVAAAVLGTLAVTLRRRSARPTAPAARV